MLKILNYRELELILEFFKEYNNVEDKNKDKDVEKAIEMISYNRINEEFIIEQFIGINDCFLDFDEEELVEFLGQEYGALITKLKKSEDDDDEDGNE